MDKINIFKIWVDSDGDITQGDYIKEYTDLKKYNADVSRVYSNRTREFADNPRKIQELLYLDKPDIIITYKKNENDQDKPILCIEFSEQTPMGQNSFQRFPRAVAAAEAGVPFVIVFPEKDWVHRKKEGTSSWEHASPFIFNGLKKLSDFHGLPVFSINWSGDEEKNSYKGWKNFDQHYSNLPCSQSKEIEKLFKFINLVVRNSIQNLDVNYLFREKIVQDLLMDLDAKRFRKGKAFLENITSKSLIRINTNDIEKYIKENTAGLPFNQTILPDYIKSRAEALIFYAETINFRSDPYTGTMLVYDYSFCRYGSNKADRHTNLIIHFPKIEFEQIVRKYQSYYTGRCPFKDADMDDPGYLTLHLRDGCKFTKQKEFRIFFYFADIIILKDKVLY